MNLMDSANSVELHYKIIYPWVLAMEEGHHYIRADSSIYTPLEKFAPSLQTIPTQGSATELVLLLVFKRPFPFYPSVVQSSGDISNQWVP